MLLFEFSFLIFSITILNESGALGSSLILLVTFKLVSIILLVDFINFSAYVGIFVLFNIIFISFISSAIDCNVGIYVYVSVG